MWDDAHALTRLTNALFGGSVLLLLVVLVYYAIQLPVFALRTVRLEGAPQRVDVTELAEVVRSDLRGNFFTLDLDRTRKIFERLPWVRKASVRRHFPWQLDVALEEQTPLATWNGMDLVNVQGEVFSADAPKISGLPALGGPDGSSQSVVQWYRRFGEIVAPLNQEISELRLSPRGAWHLRLQGGMELELGREQMEERLVRFVAAYPASVAALRQPMAHVDLRYRNGFAVRGAG